MSLLDSMMDALSVAPHTHKCIDQDESACADQCVRCAVQKLTALKPEGGMSLLDSLEEQKKEIDRLTKELEAAVKVGYVAEANVRARDIAVKHAMERAEKAEAACQVKQGVHPSWVNEVARLREENAALKKEARELPPARKKAMRDMMLSNNAAVSALDASEGTLEEQKREIKRLREENAILKWCSKHAVVQPCQFCPDERIAAKLGEETTRRSELQLKLVAINLALGRALTTLRVIRTWANTGHQEATEMQMMAAEALEPGKFPTPAKLLLAIAGNAAVSERAEHVAVLEDNDDR